MPDDIGKLDEEGGRIMRDKKNLKLKEKEDARTDLIRKHCNTKAKKTRKSNELDTSKPLRRA
jgi:hypothetical protein